MYIIEQYKSAGISPWNNNWSNNHDFTSIPDGKNYSLLDKVIDLSTKKNRLVLLQNENVFKHLPIPIDPSCGYLKIKDDIDTSVTPYTYGELYRNRNEEVRT